ncbi:MAG: isochorismatase family protein [Alphaproteobacteria bacterium]|nr:isochorismatase family protein [Alphaproteobacteria bacterium]
MMSKTWKAASNVALLNVDPQDTFCPNGGLAVEGGDEIIPVINSLRAHFEKVYWSQDYHPDNHISFASTHGKEPFTLIKAPYGDQVLWPDHGKASATDGTGAQFHKDLVFKPTDKIIQKGTNVNIDSYSAFLENDKKTPPRFANGNSLAEELRIDGVDTLVITGLALDYCVGDTAIDALTEKFNVIVIEDATRSITPEGRLNKIVSIIEAGGIVCNSKALNNLPNLKA